jgi:hypothetical protein
VAEDRERLDSPVAPAALVAQQLECRLSDVVHAILELLVQPRLHAGIVAEAQDGPGARYSSPPLPTMPGTLLGRSLSPRRRDEPLVTFGRLA